MTTLVKTLLLHAREHHHALVIPAGGTLAQKPFRFWLAMALLGMLAVSAGLYVVSVNTSILEGGNIRQLEQALKAESRKLENIKGEFSQYASPYSLRTHPQARSMVEAREVTLIRTDTALAALPQR